MEEWKKVAAAVVPSAVLLSLLIVFIRRCCRSSKIESNNFTEPMKMKHSESLQSGIAKLHLQYENNDHKSLSNFHHLLDLEKKRRTNYYVFRRGLSVKPLFSWADHPSLVSEAVEHGWARFAFTSGFMSSSSSTSTRSVLLGLCVSGDQTKESKAEISWEICSGSSDFMQKIRLNSGLKKGIISSITTPPLGASSVIKTALPLPGPFLGNFSFPQEAYFEITIVSVKEDDDESNGNGKESKKKEGEKTKLIQEAQDVNSRSDSLSHVSIDSSRFEELKVGNKEESKEETVMMMSLGLTVGGTLPSKLPGSYPGSIGFNSNASVYLDGMDLVFEAEKAPWGRKDKVIGCGFDPEQKKVFFTVDSELVHVIHCTSEEFSSPMYPTLAANADITVLVNFGQSAFMYAPANVHRIPNPCFLGPQAFGSEDSQELFSIGRIDSQWSKRSTALNNSHNNNRDSVAVDIDGESDTDFFEITLDNRSRTSSTFRNEV